MKKEFAKVFALSRETAHLHAAYSLLEWDQETYMPPAGIEARASQREVISSLIHKRKTSGPFPRALNRLEAVQADLSDRERAALREWKNDYTREKKLPPSFIKNLSHTTSIALQAWTEARQHNKFSKFAPHLKKIIKLMRKKADLLGYQEHPYDALLDLYEPDLKTSTLTTLFGKMKLALTELMREVRAAQPIDRSILMRHYAPQKQLHLARLFLHAIGVGSEHGRLDLSVHPFCVGLHSTDVRVTARVLPEYLPGCLLAALHEGGHALYQLGLPGEAFGSPLGEPASMAMDESQSRWWETLVGLSLPFWQYAYPHVQEQFPEILGGVYLEEFYRALNATEPSFIRVEADELTYSLHIILRFELEKALIEGSMEVSDIPQAWNERMRDFLGITPETDTEGCLQDIHWSMGAFGYFPSYTLGNLYAGQLFQTFQQQHPTWKEEFAGGKFAPTREWLKSSVHQHGRHWSPPELIQRVTGKPLSEEAYLTYLRNKYRQLYRI